MIKIASGKVEIRKEDLFKHLDFPFSVGEGYSRLLIKYSYYPKKYQGNDAFIIAKKAFEEAEGREPNTDDIKKELPLNNHITISLSKDKLLVGTAHRHSNEMTIEIGASSTYGFEKVLNIVGEYVLTLSTHCLLTDLVKAEWEVIACE